MQLTLRVASPLPYPRRVTETEWQWLGLSDVLRCDNWCWQGRRRNGAFQCHLRVSSDQRQCPVAISGVFYNLLMLHLVTRRKIMLVPNIVWPGFVLRDRGQRQRRGNINLGGTVLTLAHLTITGTLHRIRQTSGQISQHQLRFSCGWKIYPPF